MKKLIIFAIGFLVAGQEIAISQIQRSDRTFRKIGIHRGNQVRTVFGNWGVLAQPGEEGPRGAWLNDANGYVGDVSPMVGAEIPKYIDINNDGKPDTLHSVVVTPVSRPGSAGGNLGDAPPGGGDVAWAFEPIPGFANPTLDEQGKGIAMSHLPETWPSFWPDRPDWVGERGRVVWNGFFGRGVLNADQESYFWMDDNNDSEFQREPISFFPDSADFSRNGLGLQAKIRGLQWATFLAEDVIFWLYDFTNTSTTFYPKVAFAMLVGTYVGGTGNEWNDDVSFFDVRDDITFSWDFENNVRATANPQWSGPVGYVGYAFLESPGNATDGIDNDNDSKGVGPTFTSSDFGPRTLALSPGSNPSFPNNKIVLISKQTFERSVMDVPASATTVVSQGVAYEVGPGITLVEKPNNLLDDDLDGLIDESFDVHYRQIRRDGNGNILIDLLNPTQYKNFLTGEGIFNTLIDEDRDDGIDNDGDWNAELDDVGADGVANTRDFGENDGAPTPGEPNFDALDVDESDQIGLTSFEYFAPANQIQTGNDENVFLRLQPGFFEVPNIFVNNVATRGEDGDLLYSSGFFPLQAKKTQRFSMALLYGADLEDLIRNKRTVQEINDNNYTFAKPPELPTVTAVPGNRKVTLYWDRIAESSIDPTLRIKDFEGYKIYRATDVDFQDAKLITDGTGTNFFNKPIAQYDLKNDVRGFYQPNPDLFERVQGADFNLGNDTGLVHTFVDSAGDLENGRKYFYAVTAYDRGDEQQGIYPSETSLFIFRDAGGNIITDKNTVAVVPNAPVAGYVPPPNGKELEYASTSNSGAGIGTVFWTGLDPEKIRDGETYRVDFWDSSNDGMDNDGDWTSFSDADSNGVRTPDEALNDDVGADGIAGTDDEGEGDGLPTTGEPNVDHRDPQEFVPITSLYSVQNLNVIIESFTARDTNFVVLGNSNLVEGSVTVNTASGSTVSPADYVVDFRRGLIRGSNPGSMPLNQGYSVSYQYYPVFGSSLVQPTDSDVFDGIQLSFHNYPSVTVDTVRWNSPQGTDMKATVAPFVANIGRVTLRGLRYPNDYEVTFFDTPQIDTYNLRIPSLNLNIPSTKVNVQVKYKETGENVPFIIEEVRRDGIVDPGERVTFLEPSANDSIAFSWSISFSKTDSSIVPGSGRNLSITTNKPFRRGDQFEFEGIGPKVELAEDSDPFADITAVPNPYIAAASWEQPLPPTITSGRGERRIDFIHLPANARVHIYTVRGEHVVTLDHDKPFDDGTVTWNLRTKENLDIAYGIYFYVVQADGIEGKKEGKLAIIK